MRFKKIKSLVELVSKSEYIEKLIVSNWFYRIEIRRGFYVDEEDVYQQEQFFGDHSAFHMVDKLRNP